MRTVTSPTSIQMATKLATEPIIIIRVDWSAGTEYYGYKTDTVGAWSVQGKILDFSSIASQGKQDQTGEVSSVSLTLDDSDSSLKTKVDREVIEGKSATIYHWFEGTAQADALLILKGRIAGDIVWSEGERTLSFDIESYVEDRIIGYAPEAGDFADLWDEAIGIPWPICFGTVLKSKCVKVKSSPLGKLVYGVNNNFSSFQVEGGEEFPQSTSVDIQIGQIRYTGTFADDLFTVTTANNAYYTNLDFQDRPVADANYNDARVAWLAPASTVNLKGLYCIVNHWIYGWMVNKCIGQEGQKCYFLKPWRPSDTTLEVKLNSNDAIIEAAPIPRFSWAATYTIESLAFWYNTLTSYEHTSVAAVSTVVKGVWSLRAGAAVKLVLGYNTTYVANLIPSTEILEVYAYRDTKEEGKIFAPVPMSYYTVNLNNTLGAQHPTTIEFATDLEDYIGEEWDSDLYVSLRSSKGPNAASIIKWLIETYSSLSTDATSFASVISKLDRYPANFTVFDRPDVLDICEDIAWQTRCVLYIKNDKVYIKYLSEVPTAVDDITEDKVLLKSISLGFSSTEDIYTRVIATWKKDYSEEEGVEKEWAYSNNINTYGLRELEKDFFIYNIESLVKLSAAFWGYRYSNSWRNITLITFLEELELEIFDTPEYDLDILSDNSIRGVLDLVNHDAEAALITLEVELASNAGSVDGSNEPVENLNYFTGDPNYPIRSSNPMPTDVGTGREQVEYEVPTQGQTDSSPSSDTGGTGTGDNDQYILEFTSQPTEVQRGVNFNLAVRIKDTLGNTVSQSTTATLALSSTNGSDVLNTTTINIVNGVWSSASMQITGGSGDDGGFISVAASGYVGATTSNFSIQATRTDSLSWTSIPASVTRNATIANYTLSGGLVGETIDIVVNSTDSQDKLYTSAGVEITTVTLGVGGSYTFSGTYIRGGQGSDSATLTAKDTVQNKYTDKQSSQFSLAGISNVHVTTTISFGQSVSMNGDYLDLVQSGDIGDIYPFTLSSTIRHPNGSVATTYNEVLRLEVYDTDTDDLLTWISVGPDAANYNNFALASIENGIWSFGAVELQIPEDTNNVRIEAEILYKETQFHDSVTVAVGVPFGFYVTSDNYNITRGTPFNITIQAYDTLGAPDLTYVPTGNILLSLYNPSNPSDEIAPTYTDNTGWVNGTKTIAITVDGGIGSDTTNIRVKEASGAYEGQVAINIAAAVITIDFNARPYYTGADGYVNAGQLDTNPASDPFFATVQNNALVNFQAAVTTSGAGNPWAAKIIGDQWTYNSFTSFIYGGYARFPTTVGQRSGAKSLYLFTHAQCVFTSDSPVVWDDDYASYFNVYLKLTESAASYPSGLALWSMTPDVVVNLAEMNQQHRDLGHNPDPLANIPRVYIELPVSFLASMTGNDVYIWSVVKWASNIPYAVKYKGGSISHWTWAMNYGLNGLGQKSQIHIYK